jgi:hypothetical protein
LPSSLQKKNHLYQRLGTILLFVLLLSGLLKFLYLPVHQFIEVIFGYIHNTSVFIILTLFVTGILIPSLLMKFLKKGKGGLYNDESSISHKIKNSHDEIKKRYLDIVKTLKYEKKLNRSDHQFIDKLENRSDPERDLCSSDDFHENDEHCFKCDNYADCILRSLKMKPPLF